MFSTCVEIGRNPHKEAEHMLDRFQWEKRHSMPSTPSLFNFFTLVECFPKLSQVYVIQNHVNFKACTKNRQNQHKSNRIHKNAKTNTKKGQSQHKSTTILKSDKILKSAKTNTKKGQSQHKSTTILKTLKSDKTDTKKVQSQHKSTTILYNIKK